MITVAAGILIANFGMGGGAATILFWGVCMCLTVMQDLAIVTRIVLSKRVDT